MNVSRSAEGFNCATCHHKHCDETNPGPPGMIEIRGVIKTNICLLPMVTPESWELVRLHGHYAKGRVPFSGGVLEQPAAFVRAVEVIEDAIRQGDEEMAKNRDRR